MSKIFTATILTALLAGASVFNTLDAEEWMPEEYYAYEDDNEQTAADVNADISRWATLPSVGPEGRPLPLAGSWMAEGMWGPNRFVEMIKQGHHVLITFIDPHFVAARAHYGARGFDQRVRERIEEYRPALEFAREHNLPIAIRGWNWDHRVVLYQQEILARMTDRKITPDIDARMLENGEPTNLIDPFGPVEAWREWGTFWFGHEIIRKMQEIYPNPPMVIFLNNNEGPKVRSAGQINEKCDRFVAKFGKGPHTNEFKEKAIREGYEELFAALFESAREALIEPAWKKNVRFVAYNNLWGTGSIGQGGNPHSGIGFNAEEGWTQWRMYDGGMPELYDNDWQPGKTDYTPWSPQTEAMNYYSAQPLIFAEEPNFYWSAITWDGGRVSNAWRGRRSASKTYTYVTRGQRWDFERYEGWVQFSLWTTRPRSYREFRSPAFDVHALANGTWMAMVHSVDRPWNNETLREFWRFGELVPNRDEQPWFNGLTEDHPQWVRDLDRWYLLTCDANPPRAEWAGNTKLRVFAQALVLGEAPERRWLIYAHAPLGAVAGPTVKLPGFKDVTLESVPKSGSFFLLKEADGSLESVIVGGPDELALQADKKWTLPGETVRFEANVVHAPGKTFTGFTWSFGDGATLDQNELAPVEHAFGETGEYLVTVQGHFADGGSLIEQVAVFVGTQPAETVVYDLPLKEAFAWEGPWDDGGEPDHELVAYRHLPNRGRAPSPVIVGGTFVEDAERGSVLEINGEPDAVWLIRNRDTVMDEEGHANKTLSLWFKAQDTAARQVLYAQGHHLVGFNIYIHDGRVYAGSYAPVDGKIFDWFPVPGRKFDGHWLSSEIEPDRWYHVALVLRNATTQVQDDKQHLYVDGELVESGFGVRIPRQYGVARIGCGPIGKNLLMRFHDGETDVKKVSTFRGRLAGFRLTHDSDIP